MKRFEVKVVVEAETKEQADRVMVERLTHDESYGFPYFIDWYTSKEQVNERDWTNFKEYG